MHGHEGDQNGRAVVPNDDNDIAELLTLVGNRDQVAFQLLYKKSSTQIFGILVRILKSETTAEDALQETYMKIWSKAHTYTESLGRPMTWMTSIARYHALDILRSANTTRNREGNYAMEINRTLDDHNETDIANQQILGLCLERIEPEARDCVIRAYCEGYTHQELSQQTNVALGTIKSWVRRALLKLKDCVNEFS